MPMLSRNCMASAFSLWWSLPFLLLCKSLDFARHNIHLQVPVEVIVSNVPGCIEHVPEYFVLESLYNVYITLFAATPELGLKVSQKHGKK